MGINNVKKQAVLKIEPFSGLSGDMFLGALVELTGSADELRALPEQLNLPEAEIDVRRVSKCSIDCLKVTVTDRSPAAERSHRHLKDIHQLIDASSLSDQVKEKAKYIFQLLAEAEAAVHGVDLERVHFHEVGAVDSIVDIVGVALLLDGLEFGQVYCDPICTGYGFVKTDHGRLPVPAPATQRLLQGMPSYKGQTASELITPTGAAILRYLNPDFDDPVLSLQQSAYGAGSKDFEHPNCVRISLGQEETATGDAHSNTHTLIQTNIDDMPAEQLGAEFQQLLLQSGALDVYLTPTAMKKSRPGLKLEVLCHRTDADRLADLVLERTTTLGVRFLFCTRKELARKITSVSTPFGKISVKTAVLPSGKLRHKPEYEACRAAAREHQVSTYDVVIATLKCL